jgi:hypothetical protein
MSSGTRSVMLMAARWFESITDSAHHATQKAVIRLSPVQRRPVTNEWVQQARKELMAEGSDRLTREGLEKKLTEYTA